MKTEKFNYWMRDIVKSIHYSNNEAMVLAYQRFRNPNLRNHNYQFKFNN